MTFNIFKNNKYSTIEDVLEDLDDLYREKYFQETDNTDGIIDSDLLAKIAIREELLRNLSK
jgi:hypothetical protein